MLHSFASYRSCANSRSKELEFILVHRRFIRLLVVHVAELAFDEFGRKDGVLASGGPDTRAVGSFDRREAIFDIWLSPATGN